MTEVKSNLVENLQYIDNIGNCSPVHLLDQFQNLVMRLVFFQVHHLQQGLSSRNLSTMRNVEFHLVVTSCLNNKTVPGEKKFYSHFSAKLVIFSNCSIACSNFIHRPCILSMPCQKSTEFNFFLTLKIVCSKSISNHSTCIGSTGAPPSDFPQLA